MHGAGNDFVIFDARAQPLALTPEQVRCIANRRYGVGCDQLVVMEPSHKAELFMRIHNADGSEVDACGNASRCVAWLVSRETENAKHETLIETKAGILRATIGW
jgi:diaminopimelate epimerase